MTTENKNEIIETNPMIIELQKCKSNVEKEIEELSEAIKERKKLLKRYDKTIEEVTTLL